MYFGEVSETTREITQYGTKSKMAAKRFLLTGGAMVAATIPTVHAVEISMEHKEIKINELPIYSRPVTEKKYEFVEEEIGKFRSGVSEVRKSVCSYVDSMKDTTDKIKQKYEVSKAHTSNLITYIQQDPAVLPRAAVIAIAGLGGIVAGYRGGILRKFVLSSSAIVGAAALCYPKEAVTITSTLWKITTIISKDVQEKYQNENKNGGKKITSVTTIVEKIMGIENKKAKPSDKSLMDMGQSKEEDKDMYTTRGN